ncbi:hypothetical protein [Hydrogenophaga sp. T2]|uniref:hypothetical protein n=1 Tax=Hydrogenophaga sp. T2 TaxID=3132823 RepID=UPI003CF443BE
MTLRKTSAARPLIAAAAIALTLPAWAAGTGARTGTDPTYRQERAACAAMTDADARTSCLRDLGAARQQAQRQGRAPAPSAEQLQQNALQRCTVHKDTEQRAICERMVRGEGEVSGSVSGGGQLRSLETLEEPMTR